MSAGPLTKPDASWRLAVRPALILQFWLYVGGYAALLGWFKFVDVYHTHFADTGVLILAHNLFRVLFVFYLFWMVQAAGAILLRLIGRLRPGEIGIASYLAMTFFAGAGVWQAVLFAIGYGGLLNAPVVIVLATPVVVASFGDFRAAMPALRIGLARVWQSGALTKLLIVLLCLSWATLLIVKGLYPGNGVFYYEPYFQTYKAFLEHGSLWPHAAWWYSFYCQGAGLFFLGMLLTDAMAVQLVTFCLLSVAGLVTVLFIRNFAPRSHWPLVGAMLLFATFVYTPNWGEFRKLHEFNTAFVIAIFWMTATALRSTGQQHKIWLCATASTMTAAIIVSNYIGVFLGAVFAVLTLVYLALREPRRAFACFGLGGLAGVLVLCTLAINYFVYGLFNGWDPTLTLLWRFADVEKIYRSGAMHLVLFVLNRYSHLHYGTQIPPVGFLIRALHLEVLWPLLLGGTAIAALSVRQTNDRSTRSKCRISDAVLLLLVAFAVYVPLALVVGRSEAPTFYRFSSFTVPIVIVAGIALWTVPIRAAPMLLAWLKRPAGPIVALILCGAMLVGKTRFDPDVPRLGLHALEYTTGIISIDQSYAQPSVGELTTRAKLYLTAFYSAAHKMFTVIDRHTPIWSFSPFTFCLLPDCRVMRSLTAVMVPELDGALLEAPEKTRTKLQAAGLNYFFISRDRPFYGSPLIVSTLFSPENISRYLGIRWTDGTATLLTWSGPDTVPIDDNWLTQYRLLWAPLQDRIAQLRAVFERLHAIPHPWHPSDVPQTGWRNLPMP